MTLKYYNNSVQSLMLLTFALEIAII